MPQSKMSFLSNPLIPIGIGVLIAVYIFRAQLGLVETIPPEIKMLALLEQTTRSGDVKLALEQYENMKKDTTVSPDALAKASRDVAGLAFRQSGDVTEVLKSIADLKQGTDNFSVSANTRANNISAIAQAYMQSGENKTVFDEIFKDEPFASRKVATSTTASIRNLFLWSNEVKPNPRAAIGASSFYVMEVLNHPKLPEKAHYLAEAQRLLADAEQLAAEQKKADSAFESSRRYGGYLFWRAFVYGGLAFENVGSYKTTYARQYEEYITFLTTKGNAMTLPYLALARWHYAVFLFRVDGNKEKAGALMDQVAKEVEDTQNRDFLSLIAQKKSEENIANDFLGSSLFELAPLSKEFSTLMATK